jgi:hypothetical protein
LDLKLEFDLNEFIPSPNNWFNANIEYNGHGRAEFSDPKGTLEGHVKIKFDEFWKEEINMDVEFEESTYGSIIKLLHQNTCSFIEVITENGRFYSISKIYYDEHFSFNANKKSEIRLRFHILRSIFEPNQANSAMYWVLPLSNFVSGFMSDHPKLDRHPLRLFSIPDIPEELTDDQKLMAKVRVKEKNRLIVFNFLNRLGFIEPLTDYDARKQELLEGKAQRVITSLMIGEIGPNQIDYDNLKQWLPFQFLNLLGFATGTEVGVNWIEFRDDKGTLVQRMHANFNNPRFSKGHEAIDEVIHRGTGTLLTNYQVSLHRENSCLTAVLKHLILAGSNSLTIEDKMTHIFRAFDGLCELFGLSTQDLTQELDQYQKEIIKENLNFSALVIRTLAKVSLRSDQKNSIQQISQRVQNSNNFDRDFGLALVDLLRAFDFHDADIVDYYYQKTPRKDGRKWCNVLSHYRGVVIHSSYFNFESGQYDLFEVVKIWAHLHDILLRVVSRMLCYTGTYQRAVIVPNSWAGSYPIDWVKPDIPASELGYSSNDDSFLS